MEDNTVQNLKKYIIQLCPTLLGVSNSIVEEVISSTDGTEKLTNFATTTRYPVLFLQAKSATADVEEENTDADKTIPEKTEFSLSTEVTYAGDKSSCLVILKREADSPLQLTKNLPSQLQLVELTGSPFDTLHSFIHNSLSPYFRDYIKAQSANKSNDKDAKGLVQVNQKMSELELSLYNCKQNIQIEEVKLHYHPDIIAAAKLAQEEGRTFKPEDLDKQMADVNFLNALQAGVNVWIRNIQKVTKHERIEDMPAGGETVQEVKFWSELEGALKRLSQQLKSPEAQGTLNTLKQAKRFHATAAFDTDTIGLKKAKETVSNYKSLMKDFPINDLLTASDMDDVTKAVKNIFNHLKRTKNAHYPILRYLRLIESISKDLCNKVMSLLTSKRLMYLDYSEFDQITSGVSSVFVVWEDEFESFRDSIRDLARKRNKEKIPLRVNTAENKAVQERITSLRKFRLQHEELQSVISRVLGSTPVGTVAYREISEAYDQFKTIDVLDLGTQGEEEYQRGIKKYDDKIDKVESTITARLRDKLATAKNASEMFRVFSKFNALFFRPRIRGAIQEYQSQLIEGVKEDIKSLHDKFKQQYAYSEASQLSLMRDLPPVAGAIIWARQIDRQLAMYMKRVEDVLGKGWELDVEGQKLKVDGEKFAKKLNTDKIFERWVKDVESKNFQVSGRLLDVVKRGTRLYLDINFDNHIITLFKEVRNLQWLNFRVPFSITLLASGAKQVYPFAVSLKETIRTYNQTCSKIEPTIAPLIASYKKDVQYHLNEGFHLKWESLSKLDPFVRKLSDSVFTFQDKVDELLRKYDSIQRHLQSMGECEIREETLKNLVEAIQTIIDELNLASYSNLDPWVKELDKTVAGVLVKRLGELLDGWMRSFDVENILKGKNNQLTSGASSTSSTTTSGNANLRGTNGQRAALNKKAENEAAAAASKANVKIVPTVHEIVIRNQIMQLEPPLEFARQNWVQQLSAILGIVCGLTRLRSSRYDESLVRRRNVSDSQAITTYRDLMTKMPEADLRKVYEAIEEKLNTVKAYVNIWLQYQALWDMESSNLYSKLGDDLALWQKLLDEIKKSRRTFDTSETEKTFGTIIINYGQVQSNVNNKYDYWHKDVLSKFGGKIGEEMKRFHHKLEQGRMDLERHSIQTESTVEAVNFILKVQEIKKEVSKWETELKTFGSGQDLLRRQRFQFPSDWLEFDMVEGEWSAFSEILTRKQESINNEIPTLQVKVSAESRTIDDKIKELSDEWNKKKPVGGDAKFKTALETLKIFEGRIERLEAENDRVLRAKAALGLETGIGGNVLKGINDEMKDLQEVWNKLAETYAELQTMKETAWSAVMPRKVRGQLDEIMNRLKAFPNRIRQYSAFEHLTTQVRDYLKANLIITDLRSEALKERHWKELRKRLNAQQWVLNQLTLGDVWDVDVNKYGQIFRDIIQMATGELVLEEFIKSIRDYWTTFSLDLVNYQNKVRLIRGWDDLFTKVAEHSNSFSAMKMSPFFKVFEEEALGWEDKLNRIQELFDVWIEVQKKWVYLEGIFSGSGDIQHLLPTESSRFKTINAEFINLMRKVAKSPLILDVLAIEGILKSLERVSDLLSKIQKALGDYLEKQRSAFPRFYFVGDEDLLEIIGNSKDIVKIQKHLRKMFAGLSSLVIGEKQSDIIGMSSREGESIDFKTVISIENQKIYEWLTRVEQEMKLTLSALTEDLVNTIRSQTTFEPNAYLEWIDKFPSQLVVLGTQITWSTDVDNALSELEAGKTGSLEATLSGIEQKLSILADNVTLDPHPIRRVKYEHLISEYVHQRNTIRNLIKNKVRSPKAFEWLYEMRFYWDAKENNPLKRCVIQMANASFHYGFEYLGVGERLVQTPLTDRCYLTLTQALEGRLGGSPFGPAGTGKTETVKALGNQLGLFVIVFCCDENFDLKAMGRIFVGLCECGAWGCFDEFNRLEEKILSAVSQQIQTIQMALKQKSKEVEIIGRTVKINPVMGIFITMNPGYAGRSNLPDNLKQLFRSIAMIQPDRELIAQVMLYSQGYKTAERLSSKVVPLFKLCKEQLSQQSHYDFGLRALKSVLVSAGNIKRKMNAERNAEGGSAEAISDWYTYEQEILLRSVCETMTPKLIAEDIPLFHSLLSDVFPTAQVKTIQLDMLREKIAAICKSKFLVASNDWVEKLLQLYQIQALSHGVMMVGPSGSGKSSAWRVLLEAMEKVDNKKGVPYVLDPKAITKDELFGNLDATTREWTDGLFTGVLRRIIDNARGEAAKRHWIIFDGDVDPEWVENLNSLLDDNKILTLPNGERLALPNNVRVMFEVQDLRYATLATVSRCGMIWFSEEVLSTEMIFENYLSRLRNLTLDEFETGSFNQQSNEEETNAAATEQLGAAAQGGPASAVVTVGVQTQRDCADILAPHFQPDGLVLKSLSWAAKNKFHIMDFTRLRVLTSVFSLINKGIRNVIEYNTSHADFNMPIERIEKYITNRLIYSLLWGLGGSLPLVQRVELGRYIQSSVTTPTPDPAAPLIDYWVNIEDGEWKLWSAEVPSVEVETHMVASPDVVIPTVDTIRHEEVLHSWLSEHRPLILCGPPGSGKTMTLTSTLRSLPDFDVVSLNFSSATTPELILKTFEQHCEFKKTQKGVVLRPIQVGKWLIVFCDEINLPSNDKYGTQRVITFLRQLTEQGGFWRTTDHQWITLERIQFVGACNPPTDPGRVPLSYRFMRHTPLLLVDFPSESALHQIYGTFYRALMKMQPNLRSHAQSLTEAMVEFYSKSQKRFTPDMHAHYIYSPRELSRWMRALHEAIKSKEGMNLDELLRLWVHEGLRLFRDRLVTEAEGQWTDKTIDDTILAHFPNLDPVALKRPILFSDWMKKEYVRVERDELRNYVKARLKVFYEEELDVPLVIFDEVLDHILRIDRVFKQPQGHALLIGVSGGGKTVLSRFVAWMNGLSVFTIKVNNRYSAADFDDDLRTVMKRSGCGGEKVCFIFDESNVLESSFLERMNTLLASGEVPGLFDGDEFTALMHQCKEAIQNQTSAEDKERNFVLDTEEELYKWFTHQVRKNLHIVFTMNPNSSDFHNRSATSPALFNRCVLDWFGEWSQSALYQVGMEFTQNVDLEDQEFRAPDFFPDVSAFPLDNPSNPTHRDAVVTTLVYIHGTIAEANARLLRRQGRQNYVTPRHYLDFISHFVSLINEKREELEEQQRHLNIGLAKLKDTEEAVTVLQKSLQIKRTTLEAKQDEANRKLQQMVKDQQVAEQKKQQSLALQAKLTERDAEITLKKGNAMKDLARAEPAVEEAKAAVGGIKKEHLDEVRRLANPPSKIKKTMEAMCTLFGYKGLDWTGVKKVMTDPNFIPNIIDFDSSKISSSVRAALQKDVLSDPEWNFESVNRASKACGPLVKWITAQLTYSEILNKIQPLRDEVASLEGAAKELHDQQDEMDKTIGQLERSINKYKEEYAVLISETQNLKMEMENVKTKVERSVGLLRNLSSERTRWEKGSAEFKMHMSTLVGDVLLSSAFLAYIGFFDQNDRTLLLNKWKARLHDAGVRFKEDLSVIEYLSNADERLNWQANSLPVDDLCVENAIMLHRFNRYPLVIDPSGQASEFLMNQYKDKIKKTSFLDASFMKNLESALRFGTPLLVEDVESIDPVLNPVLNKEIRKAGGRVLIRLGDQDVDFSPTFTIYLATRDPTAHFTPDLCSRVTFVNFTVTPSSLSSQCLYYLLQSERPDIHKKRVDLLKLQGEFKVKLRNLEKSLLNALNESSGSNILEDDHVISTLEKLKNEAEQVMSKMKETDLVMNEITQVSAVYVPMAQASSSIYFALEQTALVHFLYQFSLRFFLRIFNQTLHNNNHLDNVKDYSERVDILMVDIFSFTFRQVARALLHEDQLTFALRLCQIYLNEARRSESGIQIGERELNFFLQGGENLLNVDVNPNIGSSSGILTLQQQRYLTSLVSELAPVSGVIKSLPEQIYTNSSNWQSFMSASDAENQIPEAAFEGASKIKAQFIRLLILKGLRPDRLLSGANQFVSAVFGDKFLSSALDVDFEEAVKIDSYAKAPLLLSSTPGYDASYKVDNLALKLKKPYKPLAIGSAEGFDLADKAIDAASKNGSWVMLKNIHLAPRWLVSLEKKLHSLEPHPNFRLFMTSEIHPQLPASLLRESQIFVFEPPPGIKANLLHTFNSIPSERMERLPVERSKLYFLLAWFHAVITERLRYSPLGWSKTFEFNESDLRCALDTLDYWIDSATGDSKRSNVAPEKIQWIALRTLLGQTVYGGKVDNPFDQRLLESFLNYLFTAKSFDFEFPLTSSAGGNGVELKVPDGKNKADYVKWVENIPESSETPSWLGLADNAEVLLLANKARHMIKNLLKMQTQQIQDEEEEATTETKSSGQSKDESQSSSGERPAWMKALEGTVTRWLETILPEHLKLERSLGEFTNPLVRCFEREIQTGSLLLKKVRSDLLSIVSICRGELKLTNHLRSVITNLTKGIVPQPWRKYPIPGSISAELWVVDFSSRIKQLQTIINSGSIQNTFKIWMGGLFSPEALMTATRQSAARVQGKSVEDLELHVQVLGEEGTQAAEQRKEAEGGFVVTGLSLEGGGWEQGRLRVGTDLGRELPDVRFYWAERKEEDQAGNKVEVPVYQNGTRSSLLFSVELDGGENVTKEMMYQRGVAITLWSQQ